MAEGSEDHADSNIVIIMIDNGTDVKHLPTFDGDDLWPSVTLNFFPFCRIPALMFIFHSLDDLLFKLIFI